MWDLDDFVTWSYYHLSETETGKHSNRKYKRIINTYLNEHKHGIKWINLSRNEISLYEKRGSLKDHKHKFKTWMGN